MASADKVVTVAKAEVGYLEKKSNASLDSKTANAGSKNYTKYGAWFGLNPALWCALFVCWCFAMAYGNIAKEMLCGGYSAACETMRSRFIKAGRYDKSPKVGDCIFFSGTRHAGANHIGIVYAVDGSKVYTIEGNTSGANGVIDNGGGVARKSYSKSYSRIMGYGHPKFSASGSATSKPATPTYKVGNVYTVQVNDLNVRTGAGTSYRKKSRSELTADGRKHADAEGQLKKGTRVTCKAVKTVGNQVWMQTPSGWICAYNGSKYYVK